MTLQLVPLTMRAAKAVIAGHHRHHIPPQGWLFGIGLADDAGVLVAVAAVGRPVARGNQDGFTAEVTRLCVVGDAPNACSKLYAACWRAVRAMGYRRLITYILATEPGTSVRAAGWTEIRRTKGGSWDTPSRRRRGNAPTTPKTLFEITV